MDDDTPTPSIHGGLPASHDAGRLYALGLALTAFGVGLCEAARAHDALTPAGRRALDESVSVAIVEAGHLLAETGRAPGEG